VNIWLRQELLCYGAGITTLAGNPEMLAKVLNLDFVISESVMRPLAPAGYLGVIFDDTLSKTSAIDYDGLSKSDGMTGTDDG